MEFASFSGFWNFKAKIYNGARSLPIIKQVYQAENRNLLALLPKQKFRTHLDIATGTGAFLQHFPSSKFTVVSDASSTMLSMAKRVTDGPAVLLDANNKLPFQSSSFELITAIGLLEYIENADRFFAEVHRIAENPATFVFTSSPPGFWTTIRMLTGAKPRAHSQETIQRLLTNNGWSLQGRRSSCMQDQWVCRRK